MCGIVGITMVQHVAREPIGRMLRRSLERLEYRGYDSAGIAVISNGAIIVRKGRGRISDLNRRLGFDEVRGLIGIGHTRWATHGSPTDENAHPHLDCLNRIAVVHNGIISNFSDLRRRLISRGHEFSSATDTEVIPHLIEENVRSGKSFFESFKSMLHEIEGTYAIALITLMDEARIYFARQTSPLIIGVGDDMMLVSSDIPAILEFTNRVIVVRDGEYGYVSPTEIYVEHNERPVDVSDRVRVISWTLDMASRGGYPHFMLKEIHEQPLSLRNTLAGVSIDDLDAACKILLSARRIFMTGAGTSYHAALVGEYLISEVSDLTARSFIASEYRRMARSARDGDVLIVISQSGETIDSLMALRAFRSRGAKIVSISNVVDSSIPRESDLVLYTRAGPEIGVAATKTFTAQVLVLTLLAIRLGLATGSLDQGEYNDMMSTIKSLPSTVHDVIVAREGRCKRIGKKLSSAHSAYYLGRGFGLPIAMEGALKLKEVAYIHAEAYPAGESKHGPIALVERGFPVLFVVLDDYYVDSIEGNIMEMKARDAMTIGLVPQKHCSRFIEHLDYIVEMPDIRYLLSPVVYIIPLQLIAYYASVSRGYDPDRPRNLAKTVTVE